MSVSAAHLFLVCVAYCLMSLALMGISAVSSFCKDARFKYGNSAICTNVS